MFLPHPIVKLSIVGSLGLRPPGFEFRILCLEGSVISLISPSSGSSPGPIWPVCAQKWPNAPLISFHFTITASEVLVVWIELTDTSVF